MSGSALPASRLSFIADGSDQGRCPASRPSPSGSLGSTAVQERIPGREQESHLRAATKARFPRSLAGVRIARTSELVEVATENVRSVKRTRNRPIWGGVGVVGVQQGLVGQATTE
jgi:hypothetical protein